MSGIGDFVSYFNPLSDVHSHTLGKFSELGGWKNWVSYWQPSHCNPSGNRRRSGRVPISDRVVLER